MRDLPRVQPKSRKAWRTWPRAKVLLLVLRGGALLATAGIVVGLPVRPR